MLALALACSLISQAGPEGPGPYAVSQDLNAMFPLASGTRTGHLYWPTNAPPAPAVVVGHGFARQATEMTNWGAHLASHGFAVAVLDFPSRFNPNHANNAGFMLETLTYLRSSPPPLSGVVAPTGGALVGHSAGGLSTILAASRDPTLTAAVALDPVDAMSMGATAAPFVTTPTLFLGAAPSACNARGSAATLFQSMSASGSWYLDVTGSTHCDGEDPSNGTCRATCGGDDPARRTLYRRYATAHLLAVFQCTNTEFLPGGSGLASDTMSGGVGGLLVVGNPPCSMMPVDAGTPDSGSADAGAPADVGGADASADAGPADQGGADAVSPNDLGVSPDGATSADAGVVDQGAGGLDAGGLGNDAASAEMDAGVTDGGTLNNDSGGCLCARPSPDSGMAWLAGLLGGVWAWRRRRGAWRDLRVR